LLAGAVERTTESVDRDGKRVTKTLRKGTRKADQPDQPDQTGQAAGLAAGAMLRRRVRYFTDGVVIGSRMFVNEMFAASRERFGAKRKDGARKLRGGAAAAAGVLWSIRDLRKGIVGSL
jgi:hypothetical protein